MGIDFSTLVLGPNMDTFGIRVVIDPLVSQPGRPPYAARGIYSSRPIDVAMQDGSVFTDQITTLGIRLAEFATAPTLGDRVTIMEDISSAQIEAGDKMWAGDCIKDGQGGAVLTLRRVKPDRML